MKAALYAGIQTVRWSGVSPGVLNISNLIPPSVNSYFSSKKIVGSIFAPKFPAHAPTSFGGRRKAAALRGAKKPSSLVT